MHYLLNGANKQKNEDSASFSHVYNICHLFHGLV